MIGTVIFNIYAKETHQHEPDSTFLSAVYRPRGPLEEEAEEEVGEFDEIPRPGESVKC